MQSLESSKAMIEESSKSLALTDDIDKIKIKINDSKIMRFLIKMPPKIKKYNYK